MYKIGDTIELNIEKMVYEGYGLSRLNDFVFFVENACDGDKVEAKITKLKKNFGYAKITNIIESSPHRVKPFCHLYNACGGCQWQHIEYNHQLELKKKIVEEILISAGINANVQNTIPSPKNKEFRHKIQMPVSQTKKSKRFLIGYYKKDSHEIVDIKYCPIQPQIINEITEKIRNNIKAFNINAYDEKSHKGELRHIIYRISSDSNILLCFVINNDKISKNIARFARYIFEEFSQVKGISINFNNKKNNVILGDKTKNIIGEENYIEKLGNIFYIVSPDSFFQVNPASFKNILDKVKELISKNIKNPTILDAYSGVGSFGLYLSDIAKHITCVETIKQASLNNIAACTLNNINNIEVINGDAQNIFNELLIKKKIFDVIILDPPRKGCTDETLDICTKLTDKYIIYVSCNPMSLTRDLKHLKERGFELKYIQTADMFCHTYHVETITLIEKKQNLE